MERPVRQLSYTATTEFQKANLSPKRWSSNHRQIFPAQEGRASTVISKKIKHHFFGNYVFQFGYGS